LPHRNDTAAGLRARKKARTREAIQTHALRLFRRQGYHATTVEQIIEAAEVSETTFYRYFPSKKDLVLSDNLDPLFVEAVEAHPAQVSTIEAIRAAFHSVLAELSPPERAEQRDRLSLILAVPELRAAMLDQLADAVKLLTRLIARRSGRGADDPAVRTLAGAVIGAAMTALFAFAEDPAVDVAALIDESIAHLRSGLAL
jgi:AcrR family transcriptional regulator